MRLLATAVALAVLLLVHAVSGSVSVVGRRPLNATRDLARPVLRAASLGGPGCTSLALELAWADVAGAPALDCVITAPGLPPTSLPALNGYVQVLRVDSGALADAAGATTPATASPAYWYTGSDISVSAGAPLTAATALGGRFVSLLAAGSQPTLLSSLPIPPCSSPLHAKRAVWAAVADDGSVPGPLTCGAGVDACGLSPLRLSLSVNEGISTSPAAHALLATPDAPGLQAVTAAATLVGNNASVTVELHGPCGCYTLRATALASGSAPAPTARACIGDVLGLDESTGTWTLQSCMSLAEGNMMRTEASSSAGQQGPSLALHPVPGKGRVAVPQLPGGSSSSGHTALALRVLQGSVTPFQPLLLGLGRLVPPSSSLGAAVVQLVAVFSAAAAPPLRLQPGDANTTYLLLSQDDSTETSGSSAALRGTWTAVPGSQTVASLEPMAGALLPLPPALSVRGDGAPSIGDCLAVTASPRRPARLGLWAPPVGAALLSYAVDASGSGSEARVAAAMQLAALHWTSDGSDPADSKSSRTSVSLVSASLASDAPALALELPLPLNGSLLIRAIVEGAGGVMSPEVSARVCVTTPVSAASAASCDPLVWGDGSAFTSTLQSPAVEGLPLGPTFAGTSAATTLGTGPSSMWCYPHACSPYYFTAPDLCKAAAASSSGSSGSSGGAAVEAALGLGAPGALHAAPGGALCYRGVLSTGHPQCQATGTASATLLPGSSVIVSGASLRVGMATAITPAAGTLAAVADGTETVAVVSRRGSTTAPVVSLKTLGTSAVASTSGPRFRVSLAASGALNGASRLVQVVVTPAAPSPAAAAAVASGGRGLLASFTPSAATTAAAAATATPLMETATLAAGAPSASASVSSSASSTASLPASPSVSPSASASSSSSPSFSPSPSISPPPCIAQSAALLLRDGTTVDFTLDASALSASCFACTAAGSCADVPLTVTLLTYSAPVSPEAAAALAGGDFSVLTAFLADTTSWVAAGTVSSTLSALPQRGAPPVAAADPLAAAVAAVVAGSAPPARCTGPQGTANGGNASAGSWVLVPRGGGSSGSVRLPMSPTVSCDDGGRLVTAPLQLATSTPQLSCPSVCSAVVAVTPAGSTTASVVPAPPGTVCTTNATSGTATLVSASASRSCGPAASAAAAPGTPPAPVGTLRCSNDSVWRSSSPCATSAALVVDATTGALSALLPLAPDVRCFNGSLVQDGDKACAPSAPPSSSSTSSAAVGTATFTFVLAVRGAGFTPGTSPTSPLGRLLRQTLAAALVTTTAAPVPAASLAFGTALPLFDPSIPSDATPRRELQTSTSTATVASNEPTTTTDTAYVPVTWSIVSSNATSASALLAAVTAAVPLMATQEPLLTLLATAGNVSTPVLGISLSPLLPSAIAAGWGDAFVAASPPPVPSAGPAPPPPLVLAPKGAKVAAYSAAVALCVAFAAALAAAIVVVRWRRARALRRNDARRKAALQGEAGGGASGSGGRGSGGSWGATAAATTVKWNPTSSVRLSSLADLLGGRGGAATAAAATVAGGAAQHQRAASSFPLGSGVIKRVSGGTSSAVVPAGVSPAGPPSSTLSSPLTSLSVGVSPQLSKGGQSVSTSSTTATAAAVISSNNNINVAPVLCLPTTVRRPPSAVRFASPPLTNNSGAAAHPRGSASFSSSVAPEPSSAGIRFSRQHSRSVSVSLGTGSSPLGAGAVAAAAVAAPPLASLARASSASAGRLRPVLVCSIRGPSDRASGVPAVAAVPLGGSGGGGRGGGAGGSNHTTQEAAAWEALRARIRSGSSRRAVSLPPGPSIDAGDFN